MVTVMFWTRQAQLPRSRLLLLHLVQFHFVLSALTLVRVLVRRLLCTSELT
jgi:hypothetical protein